ncbi:hypothetical protein GGR52DRAFT_448928 [Hypoxylon sp. FL1284]|nr:hypothetical protein GGR52DRAFT_448928 [Hypoxylon sp. FL1284]
MEGSPLMRAPVEVRMMIYEYLFDDGGRRELRIRNGDAGKLPATARRRRTRYHVLDRTPHRRCYDTTYRLAEDDEGTEKVSFCAALMRASRALYEETSYMVYGRHAFDFGSDVEALEPFLTDLLPGSRRLIRAVSLYKRAPGPAFGESDRSVWRSACRFLQGGGDGEPAIRRLRVVVQGGRPSDAWDGPREFSAADLRLLCDLKHESLGWVDDLSRIRGLEELEVLPDVHYCPPPSSTNMIIFAALSASIERGLTEFLRTQLCLAY